MEKNGVFSRVRSRWRSIFSKKNNPVKLRDNNRLSIERCILSDPDEAVVGTILAQATVEPYSLPNGGGIALIQETRTHFENQDLVDGQISTSARLKPSRRFHRLSSGDLSLIRRMTEEIDCHLLNVVYDEHEITGEIDDENGTEKAVFKPGPNHPREQQMIFLKQCLNNIDTRPPNIIYMTQGWTRSNFEGFLKYMMKSADCSRKSLLRVEFNNCVPSLEYLHGFVKKFAEFKGLGVEMDYVYATIHSRKAHCERKLRGDIEPFLEVEDKVRKAKISYLSNFVLTSPSCPNNVVAVRFYCLKPCNNKETPKEAIINVQLDQMTGKKRETFSDKINFETIECECVEDGYFDTDEIMFDGDEELNDDENMNADETDLMSEMNAKEDAREYLEMFPLLLNLFDKAGVCDLTDMSSDSDSVVCEPIARVNDDTRMSSSETSTSCSSSSASDSEDD